MMMRLRVGRSTGRGGVARPWNAVRPSRWSCFWPHTRSRSSLSVAVCSDHVAAGRAACNPTLRTVAKGLPSSFRSHLRKLGVVAMFSRGLRLSQTPENRMTRSLTTTLLAIAAIAAGVFAWMQTSNLTAETKLRTAAEAAKTQAEAALAAAGKDVAALKSAKDAAEAAAKSAKDEIAKIEGAKSAAEAAAKAARDEVAKVQAAKDAADAAAKAAKDEVAKLEAAKAAAEAAAKAAKDEVAKLQSAKDAAEKALADVRKAAQPQ